MPEAMPFQVLIVDDHPLMRRGISQLLQLDSAFESSPKRVMVQVQSIWQTVLTLM